MYWPEVMRRYSCLQVEESSRSSKSSVWVFVEPTAAYCPRCGGALADYRHKFSGAGNVSIEAAPGEGE
jgi:hypothetical protein